MSAGMTNASGFTVTLWSKPSCVQCTATKRKLTQLGVPFDELDLTEPEHADQLAGFKEAYGFASAPIVELDNLTLEDGGREVRVWSGFRPDLLEQIPTLGEAA